MIGLACAQQAQNFQLDQLQQQKTLIPMSKEYKICYKQKANWPVIVFYILCIATLFVTIDFMKNLIKPYSQRIIDQIRKYIDQLSENNPLEDSERGAYSVKISDASFAAMRYFKQNMNVILKPENLLKILNDVLSGEISHFSDKETLLLTLWISVLSMHFNIFWFDVESKWYNLFLPFTYSMNRKPEMLEKEKLVISVTH